MEVQERRKYERFTVPYKVVYATLENSRRRVKTTTLDISMGGIGIKIQELIKGSGKLKIQIYTPIEKEPIRAEGKLVWQDGGEGRSPERAGIQFTEIPYTKIKSLITAAA